MSGTITGQIQFPHIPSNLRIHGTFVDIEPGDNSGQPNYQTLIIGQKTSAGTATANMPLISAGTADAVIAGGRGSQLALMTAKYRDADDFGTVYYLPLADDSAAVAATLVITVSGTATASGVLSLYLAGTLVPVQVLTSATAATVASSIAAAINLLLDLPVTAAVAGAAVTLTARNAGLCGNEIDVRLNFYGTLASEVTPPGLTFTNLLAGTGTQLAGGAQNPTALASALANLSDASFDIIVFPYTDAVSLNAWQSFMDNVTGRWSWEQMLYGGAFSALRGTLGSATTALLARNDPAISITPFYDAPEPAWLWAAEIAGQCAVSLRANPAVPLQEITLNLMAPPVSARFTPGERNTLLFDGGSTFVVNAAGQVITDRMATTYQTNAAGVPDDSYLDVETRYQLAFGLIDLRTYLASLYGRKIFVDDNTRLSGTVNNAIVMPAMIRASVINRYNYLCGLGIFQDADDFALNVKVQKVGSAAKIYWPGDVANQLRQIEILVDFSKT
jgi:phage tail sheath gpL-like